jgi:hypothetical protein
VIAGQRGETAFGRRVRAWQSRGDTRVQIVRRVSRDTLPTAEVGRLRDCGSGQVSEGGRYIGRQAARVAGWMSLSRRSPA